MNLASDASYKHIGIYHDYRHILFIVAGIAQIFRVAPMIKK
jgi:hypothetical protein